MVPERWRVVERDSRPASDFRPRSESWRGQRPLLGGSFRKGRANPARSGTPFTGTPLPRWITPAARARAFGEWPRDTFTDLGVVPRGGSLSSPGACPPVLADRFLQRLARTTRKPAARRRCDLGSRERTAVIRSAAGPDVTANQPSAMLLWWGADIRCRT